MMVCVSGGAHFPAGTERVANHGSRVSIFSARIGQNFFALTLIFWDVHLRYIKTLRKMYSCLMLLVHRRFFISNTHCTFRIYIFALILPHNFVIEFLIVLLSSVGIRSFFSILRVLLWRLAVSRFHRFFYVYTVFNQSIDIQ